MVASNRQQIDDLFQAVDRLSVEEKAALVKHLLSNFESNVVSGDDQPDRAIAVQVDTMDKATLSSILQAIADRIAQEE